MDYTEKLNQQLSDFRAKRSAILADPNLSREGVTAALAKHREAALAEMTSTGVAAWASAHADYVKAEQAHRATLEAANTGYDFAKLSYHASTIASRLAGVRSADEAQTVNDQIAIDGDAHLRRAWAETAPQHLAALDFSQASDRAHVASLISQAHRDAAAILDTPAVQAARSQAETVVNGVVGLKKITGQILGNMGLGGGSGLMDAAPSHPLAIWNERARIETRFNSALGTGTTSLSFAAEPTPAGGTNFLGGKGAPSKGTGKAKTPAAGQGGSAAA